MQGSYKSKKSLEARLTMHQKMLSKHSGIIVILERGPSSKLPELKSNRFLVSPEDRMGIVNQTLNRNMPDKKKEDSLFVMTQKSGIVAQVSSKFGQFQKERDQDQALYLLYTQQETFGQ